MYCELTKHNEGLVVILLIGVTKGCIESLPIGILVLRANGKLLVLAVGLFKLVDTRSTTMGIIRKYIDTITFSVVEYGISSTLAVVLF
jgi:hypothetical protein